MATFALLVVAAASATVTVAVGSPDRGQTATASASPAGPAAPAAPAAVPPAPAAPTSAPLPTVTLAPPAGAGLHGTVDGATHGGDLRYFLLPVPDGGQPYGSPDGIAMSIPDLAKQYDSATDIGGVLGSYGYQEAATRRYRTADGRLEVSTRLMRFSSESNAQAFGDGETFHSSTPVDVPGDGAAKGFLMKPEQQAFTGHVIGISHVGDVEYEVTVYVKGDPDPSLLTDVMKRQHDRLTSGG
ncbi:hypothetical protein ACFYNO_38090 [Kitasatospora sp. NPDC006697]|uniref:hypothetical protein n=1 Tax=Kitasatospora sp. NPDC006697 TaxID=3364020 RepID=UPI0036C518C0